MRPRALLQALLVSGDVQAAVRLAQQEMGRNLTNRELFLTANRLIRWAIKNGSDDLMPTEPSGTIVNGLISDVANLLGSQANELYEKICNAFCDTCEQMFGIDSAGRYLSDAIYWCHMITDVRRRKRIGCRILSLAINGGYLSSADDIASFLRVTISPIHRLYCLILCSDRNLWEKEVFQHEYRRCFCGEKAEVQEQIISLVVDRLATNGHIRVALKTAIPLLPAEKRRGSLEKAVEEIVSGGAWYEDIVNDLSELGRPLTKKEILVWIPNHMQTRASGSFINARRMIFTLRKSEMEQAKATLYQLRYLNSDEILKATRHIGSKRIRHQILESLFFSLLEHDMYLEENQRIDYTYQKINDFSADLGWVRDQRRLHRLFREACNKRQQIDYAHSMLPVFRPSDKIWATEMLIASHICFRDASDGRTLALELATTLPPELATKYQQILSKPVKVEVAE